MRSSRVIDEIGRKPDFLVYVEGEGSHSLSGGLAEYKTRHRREQQAQFHVKGFDDSRKVNELQEPEASVDYVHDAAPRLVKVAAITAISFVSRPLDRSAPLPRNPQRRQVSKKSPAGGA